jgi:hypothetical protein
VVVEVEIVGGANSGGGGAGGYRASGFGPAPLQGSALTLMDQIQYFQQ